MGDWKEAYKNIRSRQNETNENQLSDNLYTDKGLDSKYQPLSPLTNVNEHAGVNQTKSDIAGNILARGVGTFVTGTLGTVAMLHDIPKSVFKAVTGDSDKHEGWDYFMNGSINADLAKAQEDIMKEFPLYDTYKDSKTPFTTKKVLDGITQGAAFIGVGYAGGWLTKGIFQSAKLLGNSQKLINFTNKTGKSLAVDNAIYGQINNYLDKGKNIGAAIYNRSFESMLEAKGTGQEIREKLESENQEAFDSTGQYLYNPEDIDNRVRQAEKLNFGFNLALGAIDAYQNLKIFDGFESKIGKAISKNIDDVTENILSNKNLSKFGLPKVGATIVKYGTKSGALSATGGLEALEELAQFSSNKLSQDLATNNYTKDDWDNLPKLITGIVGQMTDDIQNDPNAQFSALIGGLVGLPMGMVAKRSEDKQEALKSKQREVAQQSLIEKNVLVGLYKIKNGKTLEDKVSGEIQTRFSNHQGFQNSVINQINADNFEGLISHLENIKETSIDDLKELEIGVKTDSKGNVIQPSTIINEAIEQAKSVKKVYENVNLAHANKSELVRNNITNLILNGKYFDKKIDLVTNELETKKSEILAKITKDQNYAEKAFKTVKSKETGKEDLSFFVNGEIKNANIEELDINPETKDEVIKLKEELKQLNKEREFTIKEYNKYREPSYIGKVEKEAQKNIENLEKPVKQPVENITDNSVETPVVTNENVVKESIVPNDVNQKDYDNFINTGKIFNEILNIIANKVKNGDKLTDKETAIFTDKTSEINKIIKESVVDTSTDNTYYEAPDPFLSASEANAKDIFVPENITEELPTKSLEELISEKAKLKIRKQIELKSELSKKAKDIPVKREYYNTVQGGQVEITTYKAGNKIVRSVESGNVITTYKSQEDFDSNKEGLIEEVSPYKTEEVTSKLENKINAKYDAELAALDRRIQEIKTDKKVKEIPTDSKLKYKTFDSNEPMFVEKEFLSLDGKTRYKFDEQAASTIIKDSDLVLKPLTNNGFGSIGVFTTGKDGKLVSILRQELNNKDRREGSPTYGLDEGETGTGFLTSKKTQELFEEFFGQPFENNGILKDINKKGKLKEKEVKAFNVSFSSLNVGSPSSLTLKPTVETALDKNIHYDNNGVPTIVRILGKFGEKLEVIAGDSTISTSDIQLSKENGKGDTILLFTKRSDHNTPDKQVYPAVPITVKTIGETNTFKNKTLLLLNETVINIQEHIKNGKEGKLNETVSKPNDLVVENLYKEIKNIIRLGDGTVNLKRSKNNSKIFILEGSFLIDNKTDKRETVIIEITKDSIQGLEEFKDKLMKVIPSLSVESISELKEKGQFNVNDYLEAMTVSVDKDKPTKGVSIEIFTGKTKKDVIPSTTIKEKTIKPSDLVFKETDDLSSLFNLEIAEKISGEKPSENQLLTDVGEEVTTNDELENNNILEKEIEKPVEKLNKNLFSKNTKNVKQQEFNLTFDVILNKPENIKFKNDLMDFKSKTKNMNLQAKISAIEEFDETKDPSVLIKACE